MDAELVAAILVATLTHRAHAPARSGAGDAQLLARQPALCIALGRRRAIAAEPQLAAERQMMRRYTLELRGREFVIDVQELAADRFEVIVGDETYEVTLSGDEDLPEATITPGYLPAGQSGAGARPPAAAPVAQARGTRPRPRRRWRRSPARAGGGGCVLERADARCHPGNARQGRRRRPARPAGRRARRDEDAQLHRRARGPARSAKSASTPGQAVGHGDAIVRYTEG